jgi:enolase
VSNNRSRITTIKDVMARKILDSRGNPTVQIEILLRGGEHGVASVPSGCKSQH